MWKKFKESEFLKRMKRVRVNRVLYFSVIAILLTLSVVLVFSAAMNRAKKNEIDNTQNPDQIGTNAPENTQNPDDSAETGANAKIPELGLPVSGTLAQKHSVDVQVFSPTMKDYRVHLGIDIATAENAPVCAAADGTVAQIWEDPMMGWCIALSHDGECVTVYKNLAKDMAEGITVGADVLQGQLLGQVGDSALVEIAQEPHLHMEMTVKGLQADPMEYFSESVIATLSEDDIYENGK